ncbi:hypothetical protein D9615_001385 [Tricholomella constricta]|uniref:Uncharacterized protein n=1 Tax=Tricholomella constricta TaxID=117010 RepID=A0A8H5HL13_9AGAR|nr:hypothetical protein D9615_001385 [Tricholomella constricta]
MNPRKFTLTLFVYIALVLALSASSNAHIQQRGHANLKRLIKKRSPFPQDDGLPLGPVAGAGAAVPTFPVSSSSATSTSSVTSEPSASETSSASDLSTSSSAPESTSATESSTSASESSTTVETSQTTSTTATSEPPAPTSESLNVIGAPDPTSSKATVTLTESVDASHTPSSPPQIQSNATKPKSTAVTALIIVASSLAGVAILWTVFRKWKLGRSSKFDERLQPIDWQPTNPDDALPGSRRRLSGASSFRSGSGNPNSARGYGTSDHGHDAPSSYAIPDHDFTAGSSTLAPVGGYADLARGPSPQPQMNQMSHGPSLTRPAYDVNVPLHHQAGYGTQDAYDYGASRRY